MPPSRHDPSGTSIQTSGTPPRVSARAMNATGEVCELMKANQAHHWVATMCRVTNGSTTRSARLEETGALGIGDLVVGGDAGVAQRVA